MTRRAAVVISSIVSIAFTVWNLAVDIPLWLRLTLGLIYTVSIIALGDTGTRAGSPGPRPHLQEGR